jgi:hypothetical protein
MLMARAKQSVLLAFMNMKGRVTVGFNYLSFSRRYALKQQPINFCILQAATAPAPTDRSLGGRIGRGQMKCKQKGHYPFFATNNSSRPSAISSLIPTLTRPVSIVPSWDPYSNLFTVVT